LSKADQNVLAPIGAEDFLEREIGFGIDETHGAPPPHTIADCRQAENAAASFIESKEENVGKGNRSGGRD
jgi:hypothetical protein